VNSEAIALFYAGVLVQAVFLLLGQLSLKDARMILACCAGSVLGLIPGKHEHSYNLSFHLFMVACFFAVFYALCFKKKILVHIDKEILLVWTLVGLYIALQAPLIVSHPPLLIPLLILSLIAIINAFAGFDNSYRWQVYFYVWFLCILVGIAASRLAFSTMFSIFGHNATPDEPLERFVIGMSFLYLAVNLWYVIELIPLPGKHQSFKERLKQVEKDMDVLAGDYDVKPVPPWKTLLLLILTVSLLTANYTVHFVSDDILIPVLIAVLPVLDKLKIFTRAPAAPVNTPDNN